MKNLIVLFISLFGLMFSCQEPGIKLQENQYLINGTVNGLTGPCLMYVTDGSTERGFRVDSIDVDEKGSFQYIGKIEDIDFLRFYPGNTGVKKAIDERSYFPSRGSQFNFFGYPGAKINFTGNISDFVDAYATDSEGINDPLSALHKDLMPLVNDVVNLSLEAYLDENADTALINSKTRALEIQQLEIKKTFYRNNPADIATSMYVLEDFQRQRITLGEAENYVEALKSSNPTKYTSELLTRIDAARKSMPGQEAPSIITGLTRDSSKFNLKTLDGKYVVLDFWGTWCMPCIEGMPAMKEYWKKYEDKLELVGIAQDRSQKVWHEFLDKNEFDWIHLFNGEGDEDFVSSYNVNAYPTKVIIDPDGIIVDRFVGEGEEFYEKLEEILQD